MPIGNAPVKDLLEIDPEKRARWTSAWITWFTQVLSALAGWKKTYTGVSTHDFGSISSGAESSFTVAVVGARAGDAVVVSPSLNTVGIVDNFGVSGTDLVTVYAKNITSGSINPASKSYRVIVFQQ